MQSDALDAKRQSEDGQRRDRLVRLIGEIDRRTERQVAAIEAGVDPAVVSERISSLKAKRAEAEDLLSQLDTTPLGIAGPEDSLAILEGLPDPGSSLASADPKPAARSSTPSGSVGRSTEMPAK